MNQLKHICHTAWLFFFMIFLSYSVCCAEIFPVFDEPDDATIPRLLRIVQPLKEEKEGNFVGLDLLKASGSAQFSEKAFKELLRYLPLQDFKLVIYDLREESHGFVNSRPVSWTNGINNHANLNKSKFEIESDENNRLQSALQGGVIHVKAFEKALRQTEPPLQLTINSIKTERELIEEAGATYIRLPVTDHHPPSDEIVDQFVELVARAPSHQWNHFHCRAGKGRTTTFLVLLDMIKNARHVSFEEILERHKKMGGSDLYEAGNAPTKTPEQREANHKRLSFIKTFYLYCNEVPDFHLKWSTWKKQKSIP